MLHLLCQLLDLPAQGSILPLQVFTLLRRQNHRGFLSSVATGMSWGHGGRSPAPLCPAEFPELHISGKFGTEPCLGKPPRQAVCRRDAGGPSHTPWPQLTRSDDGDGTLPPRLSHSLSHTHAAGRFPGCLAGWGRAR